MAISVLLSSWLATSSTAFTPMAATVQTRNTASSGATTILKRHMVDKSLEEEIERTVQEELRKKKVISNLRNKDGVDYAPWMNISADDEQKIRQLVRERAEARKKRQLQEQNVKGALLFDSQAQELSGVGLRSKVIDNAAVELEWATSSEKSTRGFIVKRRPAKTEQFSVLASYESYGPLASKGKDGGVYRFLDENVSPGGWVYRITECESSGAENDLSQCLVEVQTVEEQKGAVLAAVGFAVVAIAAVVAGTLLDPVQY
jgi:hypothetical protein